MMAKLVKHLELHFPTIQFKNLVFIHPSITSTHLTTALALFHWGWCGLKLNLMTFTIGHIRIPSIGLGLACNEGSCMGILLKRDCHILGIGLELACNGGSCAGISLKGINFIFSVLD